MVRILFVLWLTAALLRAQDDSAAMKQAELSYGQGDMDGAIGNYGAALQINPKDTAALFGRGKAYQSKVDDDKSCADKAIADFNAVLALDPKNEKAWYELGCTQEEKAFFGSNDEKQNAVDALTHAVQLDPKDAEAWRMRGMAYGALFQRDKQLADDNSAIEADPKYAAAYNDRAATYDDLKQFDKALADYSKAIEFAPRDEAAGYYSARASTYEQMKDYVHAAADYAKATELAPNDVDAQIEMAAFLATCPDGKVRDGKKALAAATKANDQFHGRNPMALQALAAACAETGDFDNAIKWQTKYCTAFGITPSQDSRLALYKAHKPYRDDGSDSEN
jgi:tetratricopeptide (TPR) repeat protein